MGCMVWWRNDRNPMWSRYCDFATWLIWVIWRVNCTVINRRKRCAHCASTIVYWPHAFSDFHGHSFAMQASAIWNNITFKTAFKTYLFNSSYTLRQWQWSIGTSDSLLVTYGADKRIHMPDWLIDLAGNRPFVPFWGSFGDIIWKGGPILTQRTRSHFSSFLPLFVNIDQEIRPCECGRTTKHFS